MNRKYRPLLGGLLGFVGVALRYCRFDRLGIGRHRCGIACSGWRVVAEVEEVTS
jgi:hypothetical protein